jgi:hypothetical protein
MSKIRIPNGSSRDNEQGTSRGSNTASVGLLERIQDGGLPQAKLPNEATAYHFPQELSDGFS